MPETLPKQNWHSIIKIKGWTWVFQKDANSQGERPVKAILTWHNSDLGAKIINLDKEKFYITNRTICQDIKITNLGDLLSSFDTYKTKTIRNASRYC